MSETRSKYSLKGATKLDIGLAILFTVVFCILVAVLALNGPFKDETNANQPLVPTAPTNQVAVNYSPLLLLSGVGIIVVGIFVIVWVVRQKLARIYVGQGMLAWIAIIIVGTIVGSFLDKAIQTALGSGIGNQLYLGIKQGLIYTLIIYLIASRGLKGATWQDAVGFGIGFGLVEQMAIGGLANLVLAGGVLASGVAPAGAITTLNMMDSPLGALVTIINSTAFIAIRAASAALIFYAITHTDSRRWLWLLGAALFEGAAYTASYLSNDSLTEVGQTLTIAAAILLWAAFGYTILRWLQPRYPQGEKKLVIEPL